jgi:hypothetical protein
MDGIMFGISLVVIFIAIFIFSNFLMKPGWRASLRQISTELANLFQQTLKSVASRHKCGDTIPKKPVFCRFFLQLFLKNKEFVTKYSVFRKLCHHLAVFRPKKITDS